MSETEFRSDVVRLAEALGWRVQYQYDGRNNRRAKTKGFPDLVMVRGERALFVELKTDIGWTTPSQDEWLRALKGAGLDVRVWRPMDWPEIEDELS